MKASVLPKTLYITDEFSARFASEKQGTTKFIPFTLKLSSTCEKNFDLVLINYKLLGISLEKNADYLELLKRTSTVLIGKNDFNNWIILNEKERRRYSNIGIYDIVERNGLNTQRKRIEAKQRKTRKERQAAVEKIELLADFTDKYVGINKEYIRNLLNKELKKEGFAELPKNANLYLSEKNRTICKK